MAALSTEITPDGLLIVTIDSPPMNLYDEQMHAALNAAIDQAGDRSVGAVLFEARGTVFTGGVDLSYIDRLGGPTAAETLFTEMIDMVHRLERLPVPTVLAAHATCLTWGFELALACDLIVAAENVRFGMIERRFALTPAMGGTQRLAARCGVGRASEMVLTAGLYSAADLATWNAINLVLPDEDFVTAARTYAADLATGPGQSHHAAKTILREYVAGGVSAADALTPAISGALFADDEHKRRVSEYLSAHRTAPGGS